MKVLLQQTAEYLANLAERELLPDDSCIPSFCSRHKRIGWRWGWF
jgi:hypothetical protein